MTPYLHPESQRQYEQLLKHLPHALLIIGEKGRGASTIAKELATTHSPVVQEIVPEKDEKPDPDGKIGVERIKQLYERTRSIVSSARIIVIHDVHSMTPQAQNAFLKLLEEPAPNTHFILAAHTRTSLLPTVLSRVQSLDLRPITEEQSVTVMNDLGVTDAKKRAQLLFLAAGNPAELTRLSDDEKTLADFAVRIADARALLQSAPYEKLLIAHKYKDARADILRVMDMALQILRRTLTASPENQQLIAALDEFLTARERIYRNGNIRLIIARLVV